MSIVIRSVTLAACLASVSGGANPQPPSLRSEHSEPHESLAFFEGTWTVDGDPEGWRETCSWLPEGRRHMVCRARWQTANGPREGLGVFSYDQPTGEYLYRTFSPDGAVTYERVQRLPKGWLYTSERGTGAERVRTRETLEERAEGRVSAIRETAKAEGPWVVDRRVEFRRTRP